MKPIPKKVKMLCIAIAVAGTIIAASQIFAEGEIQTYDFTYSSGYSNSHIIIYYPKGMTCSDTDREVVKYQEVAGQTYETQLTIDSSKQLCFSVRECQNDYICNGYELVSAPKRIENIANVAAGTLKATVDETGFIHFDHEFEVNLAVTNAGPNQYSVQFFMPYNLETNCQNQYAEPLTQKIFISANSTADIKLDPGYLPIQNPNGNGYVCLYVESGSQHSTYGPFNVTDNSKCGFKFTGTQDLTQECS